MHPGEIGISGFNYEQAYRALVEHSPVPLWITLDGRIVFVNEAGTKLLGGDRAADLLGHSPFDILHPRGRSLKEKIDQLETGEASAFGDVEEEFVRLDGSKVTLSITASVLHCGGDRAVQVHCIDRTEQKKAEQVQRLQSELLLQAYEPIFAWELGGSIVYWNDAAESLYGYRRGDAVGTVSHALLQTEQLSGGAPLVEQLSADGEWTGLLSHTSREGRRLTVESHQRLVKTEDGSTLVIEHNRDVTAQLQHESALRESEERFRATFEQAAVGIAHLGVTGHWLRVNQRLCEMVGYSRDELIGLSFANISYPEDLESDWTQAQALLRGEIQTYSMEKRYLRKDQSLLWTNLTVSLVRDSSGLPDYFISVIEDISTRKQVETELRASEDRFRTLFETSPVAKYLIDPDTWSLLAFNDQAATQFGYSREELAQLSFAELDASNSPEQISAVFGQNLKGINTTFEACHRRQDGELRDVLTTSQAIVLNGRSVIYASVLDFTDRKRAERARQELNATLERRIEERTLELEEQRLFLEAVLDTIDVGVTSCDRDGRLILFNRTTRRWHGLPEEAVPMELWSEHYSLYEKDGRTLLATEQIPLVRALRGEWVRDAEIVIAPASGPERRVVTSGQLLKNARGETLGAVVAMHDVTRQKQAEAQLREANRELEAFSYSVSHDLRAPLRSVDGFGQILLRDYSGKFLDERAVSYIRRMSAATARMGQLIEDLLSLSRVSRDEFHAQSLDLSRLARDIVRELRERDPGRDVTVSIEDGLLCNGDARLLRIALTNLFANAWKFTGKTPDACIELRVAQTGVERIYRIRDNGAGFDMAHAELLFAPFQRLHGPAEFEGTGIGLAIVQRVIHRHGGQIWAESEEGRGAAFYFTLKAL